MPQLTLAKKLLMAAAVAAFLPLAAAHAKSPAESKPAPNPSKAASKVRKSARDDIRVGTATNSAKRGEAPARKGKRGAVKDCNCACPASAALAQDARPNPWWECTGGCLRSWGVSVAQVTLCGASCAFGAIPICAICVGVDVSVVTLCSIGCAIYSQYAFDYEEGPVTQHKTRPRGKSRRPAGGVPSSVASAVVR